MKPNNSMLGGAMRKTNFEPYAQYFLKFLEGYKAEGVAIDAVTVQNETDAEQEGQHVRLPVGAGAGDRVRERASSGPRCARPTCRTKIWVLDHNYNLWGRAIDELSDPAAYEYIDGIAWHGYVGEPTAMSRVHDAFPQKNAYWTEGGPDIKQPDYQTDYTKWADQFNGILNNWARSITAWNLALDENGKPECRPILLRRRHHHRQASRTRSRAAASTGPSRITPATSSAAPRYLPPTASATTARRGPVSHAGFRNPDGSYVVVLANTGAQKRVQLAHRRESADVELPSIRAPA